MIHVYLITMYTFIKRNIVIKTNGYTMKILTYTLTKFLQRIYSYQYKVYMSGGYYLIYMF